MASGGVRVGWGQAGGGGVRVGDPALAQEFEKQWGVDFFFEGALSLIWWRENRKSEEITHERAEQIKEVGPNERGSRAKRTNDYKTDYHDKIFFVNGLLMNFFKSIICFLKIYYLFPKANCINERDPLIWLR